MIPRWKLPIRRMVFVAGEPSGDRLAAALARELKARLEVLQPFPPQMLGAGGPQMRAAGIELLAEITGHAAVGFTDVLRLYRRYRALLRRLTRLTRELAPDLLVLVDFTGFNRRLAAAVRKAFGPPSQPFQAPRPMIVQYVSPQVWASRPGRARLMARCVDLLLCLFAFEKGWYAARTPELRVEWVGHPICDAFPEAWRALLEGRARPPWARREPPDAPPLVLLLPGSRPQEIRRHLPAMLAAVSRAGRRRPLEARAAAPTPEILRLCEETAAAWGVRIAGGSEEGFEAALPGVSAPARFRLGGLAEMLPAAAAALASTGTVTLECALFATPTVAMYKTSGLTYAIGRRIVTVPFMAMPNILAGGEVFPELIQAEATPENLAEALEGQLSRFERRGSEEWEKFLRTLRPAAEQLGGPGAARRAADAILRRFGAAL